MTHEKSENETKETIVTTKAVITPNAEGNSSMEIEENKAAKNASVNTEVDAYEQGKAKDHSEIVQLIAASEKELADLKLRKALMEADFPTLLAHFQTLIGEKQPISPIAKKTLLEYLSYELLKPLLAVGLRQSDTGYDRWETKHFVINYQLDTADELVFQFKMNPIDERFNVEFMPLLKVAPQTMQMTVDDGQVLELIRLWHADKVFSLNQLAFVNYDLNQLLNHLRQLGFVIKPSLLDNTQALNVQLESEFSLETPVLDDIFITTMEESAYDFEKLADDHYQVLLDQEQKVTITKNDQGNTELFINSEMRRRSILDFFTNYPFLVPLMVREK